MMTSHFRWRPVAIVLALISLAGFLFYDLQPYRFVWQLLIGIAILGELVEAILRRRKAHARIP
jgi:hypothetical protein